MSIENLSTPSPNAYPLTFLYPTASKTFGSTTPQPSTGDEAPRWDNANPHQFGGTYGEYLLNKVGKVFPGLKDQVL